MDYFFCMPLNFFSNAAAVSLLPPSRRQTSTDDSDDEIMYRQAIAPAMMPTTDHYHHHYSTPTTTAHHDGGAASESSFLVRDSVVGDCYSKTMEEMTMMTHTNFSNIFGNDNNEEDPDEEEEGGQQQSSGGGGGGGEGRTRAYSSPAIIVPHDRQRVLLDSETLAEDMRLLYYESMSAAMQKLISESQANKHISKNIRFLDECNEDNAKPLTMLNSSLDSSDSLFSMDEEEEMNEFKTSPASVAALVCSPSASVINRCEEEEESERRTVRSEKDSIAQQRQTY